jgi:hypothetical protein
MQVNKLMITFIALFSHAVSGFYWYKLLCYHGLIYCLDSGPCCSERDACVLEEDRYP